MSQYIGDRMIRTYMVRRSLYSANSDPPQSFCPVEGSDDPLSIPRDDICAVY